MKLQKEINPIDSFVSSLSYWQETNLKINFLKLVRPSITREEAYEITIMDSPIDKEELKRNVEQLIGTVIF